MSKQTIQNRRARTKRLAVSALLVALGTVLSYLGSLIDVLDLCTSLFTALLLVPVVIEYGRGWPWGIWCSTTVLTLLVLPNKAPALVYAVFGYYPILKAYLERLPRLPCLLLKQVLFVAVDITLVWGSSALFGVEEAMPTWYPLALTGGGLLVLELTDIALTRLITAYVFKYRKHFKKWIT